MFANRHLRQRSSVTTPDFKGFQQQVESSASLSHLTAMGSHTIDQDKMLETENAAFELTAHPTPFPSARLWEHVP